jgi:hypothetical protein
VSGFHPDVGWRLLAEGAYAVAAGLPWVASNVDPTIPMPQGNAPGNGALVEAIRLATGRRPEVAGKPEPPIHREAVLRTGALNPLVVGDRLDTDIAGAARTGTDSLLVLTGVTSALDLITAGPESRPTYVARDLRALSASSGELRVKPGESSRGGHTAMIEQGRLVIRQLTSGERTSSQDDADDSVGLLRAICGAVWAAADQGRRVAGVESVVVAAGWPVPPSPSRTY